MCTDDDERVIARYIARNLNEPKIVLIERVVRYTSRQKALDLFNPTMDVEAAGGMKTWFVHRLRSLSHFCDQFGVSDFTEHCSFLELVAF